MLHVASVHRRALRAFSSLAPSPLCTAVLPSPAPQREYHPSDRCLTRLTRPGAPPQAAPTYSRDRSCRRSRSSRLGRGASISAPTHRCTATLPSPMLQTPPQKQELPTRQRMLPRAHSWAVMEQSRSRSRSHSHSRSSRMVRVFTKYVFDFK